MVGSKMGAAPRPPAMKAERVEAANAELCLVKVLDRMRAALAENEAEVPDDNPGYLTKCCVHYHRREHVEDKGYRHHFVIDLTPTYLGHVISQIRRNAVKRLNRMGVEVAG